MVGVRQRGARNSRRARRLAVDVSTFVCCVHNGGGSRGGEARAGGRPERSRPGVPYETQKRQLWFFVWERLMAAPCTRLCM